MKPIDDVIAGSEDHLKERVWKAVLETGRPSIVRRFDREFDGLSLEDKIGFAQSLKLTGLFY